MPNVIIFFLIDIPAEFPSCQSPRDHRRKVIYSLSVTTANSICGAHKGDSLQTPSTAGPIDMFSLTLYSIPSSQSNLNSSFRDNSIGLKQYSELVAISFSRKICYLPPSREKVFIFVPGDYNVTMLEFLVSTV